MRAALSNKAQGKEQQHSEEIPQPLPTLLSFLLSLLLLFIPGPFKNRFDTRSKPAPALEQETGRKLFLQLLSFLHLHDSSYYLVFTSIPVPETELQLPCKCHSVCVVFPSPGFQRNSIPWETAPASQQMAQQGLTPNQTGETAPAPQHMGGLTPRDGHITQGTEPHIR